MFTWLINKGKELLYKMGLISGIKKVTDNRKITIDEESYKQIDIWKAIYSGHFSEWHDLKYQTVEGQKQRRMASLNMAKVVTQEMSSLIFNEKCSINISDEALFDNIKNVLDDNNFNREFQRHLEYMLSLGGMVIKAYYDGDIKLSFVTADCFVPVSWDNNKVTEGVFINESTKAGKYYTLLEWHLIERGEEGQKQHIIKNELYVSRNKGELGVRTGLKELYEDLEDEVRINDLSRPTFIYFKPNTANNLDLYSPLGISLYGNSLDVLKSLDIAFDSFQREFVLGKKRIIVPASAIKHVVDPISGMPHRYFDSSDEVYEAMKIEGDQRIQDISVELRVEEHTAAINALLNYLSMQTGFSTGAFSFDGQGVKTATEVVSENSKTFKTKQSHETILEDCLRDLVDVIVDIAALYDVFKTTEDYEVTVTFDDSIAEDQTAEINKQILLVTSGLTSKIKALMKIHGISEEEAKKLLKQIIDENRMAMPENVDFFNLEGNPKQEQTNNGGE
ncbi:phage portal protein [Bacillus thuringiensis]|nr:phage portal protein [Bacillus thuringiensis]